MRGGFIEAVLPVEEYETDINISSGAASAGQVIDYPNQNKTVLLICPLGCDAVIAFGLAATVLATNTKTGNRRAVGTNGNRRQFTVKDGAIYKFTADPATDKAYSALSTSVDYSGKLTITVA